MLTNYPWDRMVLNERGYIVIYIYISVCVYVFACVRVCNYINAYMNVFVIFIWFFNFFWVTGTVFFLAVTKQLYEWFSPSVRPSVCQSVRLSVRLLSHFFNYVPIIASSWNFQELLPMTKVMSMQKVKVKGQRSRSKRSWPHFAVSGP